MIPSTEEISAGRTALRGIGTYEERKRRMEKGFVRSAFFGLAFIFCTIALGGGLRILLVVILLWFGPKIFMRLLLRLELTLHRRTLRRLREKYGSAIDDEMEKKASAFQ